MNIVTSPTSSSAALKAPRFQLVRVAALAGALLLAGALTGRSARADSIGINFTVGGNPLDATTSAGVVAQTNWNNLSGASGTSGVLRNNLGATTTTTLTYAAANRTEYTDGTVPGGDEQLNSEYLISGRNTPTTFTLNNISFSNYDIYVYNLAPQGTQQQTTLGPTSFFSTSPNPYGANYVDNNANTPYTYTQATSTSAVNPTADANYVRFSGLSGTSQSFSVTGLGLGGLSAVGGIQLVQTSPVPEPSTWAMMALGVGAMGLVVRRKRKSESDAA